VLFEVLVFLTATVAAAIASVAGFGIGSLVTPVLATQVGMRLAVAVVALPHFAATLLRAWRLRRHVDRRVALGFGAASAVGGLAGAALQGRLGSPRLAVVLGALLVFAGVAGLTGLMGRVRFGRRTALAAGVLSGGFGGLVGNQGGIRSAALLAFDLPKEAFVATATAVGVVVDVARVPVYLVMQGGAVIGEWRLVLAGTLGALVGTLAGERVLRRLPQVTFVKVVCGLLVVLGIALLGGGARGRP
jgi:uncharacterized membrane protein YfcA